jgi:hypothetical protein
LTSAASAGRLSRIDLIVVFFMVDISLGAKIIKASEIISSLFEYFKSSENILMIYRKDDKWPLK